MSFSFPFFGPAYPYFTGSIVATRPVPLTVQLDGQDYLIDLKLYRNNGLEQIREAAVASGEPSDDVLNPRGAWWRYRSNWSLGAGQEVADFGEAAKIDGATRRFWRSRGIDPWTEHCLKLHNATESVLACTADVLPMVATGGFVYVGDGTGCQRSADLAAWAAVTGLAGTVQSITTDGTDVYIATTSNIYRVQPGSVAASAVGVADDYQIVGFVANRLLAGADNVLGEIKTGPAFDDIWTHYQAAFRWTAIFNIGSRIYAGGFAGNRSELYSIQTNDAGDLVRAQEAAPFAYGELLRGGIAYGGAVLLVTSLGVRFAQVGGDGSLTYGPLISASGDTKCAVAEGNFAWFGWSAYPDSGSGLGRLRFDEFVDTLQPPYASDVFTEAVTASVVSVARFGSRTLFAVAGEAVYASIADEYIDDGWIDSGRFFFGTVEPKKITELVVTVEALQVGDSVAVLVEDQANTDLGDASLATTGATGFATDLAGSDAYSANMRFTLASTSNASTPCIKFWRMRAFPVVPFTEEWILPLIIQSHVVMGEGVGQRVSVNVFQEVERLKELCRAKTPVAYREGRKTNRVRIDNFQIQTHDWLDTSDYFEVTMILNLISV